MENKSSIKFVGFGEAVKNFWVKYFDAGGCSTRAEYWWAGLFLALVGLVTWACAWLMFTNQATAFLGVIVSLVYWVFWIVALIPHVMLSIRRMHDIGISGWWHWGTILLAYFLMIGGLSGAEFLIVFSFVLVIVDIALLCLPSVVENNKYRTKKHVSSFVLEEDDE